MNSINHINSSVGIKYLLCIASISSFLIVSCTSAEDNKDDILRNWSLKSSSFSGDRVLLEWMVAPKDCIGAEIKYVNLRGDSQTVIVPSYKTTFELLNYNASGSSFKYRSVYLREKTSVDTLYANYKTVSDIKKVTYALPEETSKYNIGGSLYAGRYKNPDGSIRYFELVNNRATLYDGGGRALGTVTQPVKINMGTEKKMTIQGQIKIFIWAWDTNIDLSGWMDRNDLVDPPAILEAGDPFNKTNPTPPHESEEALVIDAVSGYTKLLGLGHRASDGLIPSGGNRGIHYAGRNPGPLDYVYLLRAVPNVQKGGTSKDSMPHGSLFIPALDEYGRQIIEVMTMYLDDDFNKPVNVTFVYGRAVGGSAYGWIARANIGEI